MAADVVFVDVDVDDTSSVDVLVAPSLLPFVVVVVASVAPFATVVVASGAPLVAVVVPSGAPFVAVVEVAVAPFLAVVETSVVFVAASSDELCAEDCFRNCMSSKNIHLILFLTPSNNERKTVHHFVFGFVIPPPTLRCTLYVVYFIHAFL